MGGGVSSVQRIWRAHGLLGRSPSESDLSLNCTCAKLNGARRRKANLAWSSVLPFLGDIRRMNRYRSLFFGHFGALGKADRGRRVVKTHLSLGFSLDS